MSTRHRKLILWTRRRHLSPTSSSVCWLKIQTDNATVLCVLTPDRTVYTASPPILQPPIANNLPATCLSLQFLKTVQYNHRTHCFFNHQNQYNMKVKTAAPYSCCSLCFCQEFFPSDLLWTGIALRNMWLWPQRRIKVFFFKKNEKIKMKKCCSTRTPIWPLHSPQATEQTCQSWRKPEETTLPP